MRQTISNLQSRVSHLEDKLLKSSSSKGADAYYNQNLQETIVKIVRQELKKQQTAIEETINEILTDTLQDKIKIFEKQSSINELEPKPTERKVSVNLEQWNSIKDDIQKDVVKKLQSKTSNISSAVEPSAIFKFWENNEIMQQGKWRGSNSKSIESKTEDNNQKMLNTLMKKLNENCLSMKKEINDSLSHEIVIKLEKERKVLLDKMKSQITQQMRDVKRSTVQDVHDTMDTKFKSNKSSMEKSLMISLKAFIEQKMTNPNKNTPSSSSSYKTSSLNRNKSLSMSNLKTRDKTLQMQGIIRLIDLISYFVEEFHSWRLILIIIYLLLGEIRSLEQKLEKLIVNFS